MTPRAVSVFFGSQTGCAESIAQRIYDEALERQLDAELHPLNEFQKSKVETRDGHFVVIVCSTTGNGDPPDNCGKFWRYVKRRTQPNDMLSKLRYTVLGLGDTNYDKFCFMGKSIEKRMRELGAQSFYEFGAADEAMGLEDSVEPWLNGLWVAFDEASGAASKSADNIVTTDSNTEESSVVAADSTPSTSLPAAATSINTSYLLENLISYEKMFGPLETPTEVPEDIPRLQSSLLSLRFLTEEERQEQIAPPTADDESEISSTNPFMASVIGAEYLTAQHAERKVLRLDIDVSGSGINYVPGDSIGIKCPNRSEDVDALLACLGINGDEVISAEPVAATNGRVAKKKNTSIHFPSPCSARDVFLHHVDILTSPKKAAVRALATYCSDEEQRARMLVLSSKTGAEKYKAFITEQHLNVVELLHLFPSCKPPLDHLLTLLPQQMPRYYSIATSPLVNPTMLSVAFTVVEHAVGEHGLRRRGLCTNWLAKICQPLIGGGTVADVDVRIPIFLRGTQDFHLPGSAQSPMLLIGPGTGVAPFMGFLQHRHIEVKTADSTRGDSYLFFGCRRQSEDWLFREKMHEYVANGTLTKLFTAFSRDQDEKHYVQHDLRNNGKLVCDLLMGSDGYVFVCGDGMAMAKDVHAALVGILTSNAGMSQEAAELKLRELGTQHRYVRDIW
ncbi:Methionine synthase reductase [Phytophthora fragariae]|uniref:Methionine synthase reductase n=1 Tax=Phytophthora fragariae TaxID=53985 RepID=A0A6A3FK85_9STRA|nr:Methionine synthase reductase [Phytophthora fragariae]KAE8946464.1 Methionine synthase reductase [Phytophthora fragariae]KAE9026989.1 Methionine synthase reductase [Phytophthora fragariae]KAE9132392.1 Methionine synthase reductase [Phytophthora fragariae]KAE9132993.1 Methionine synthase reductase [Phytophthora fragariae]